MELTEKQIEEALEWEATVTRERRELIERMDEQGNRVNLKAREPQGPEILAAAYRAEHERAERLEKALRVLLERVEPLVDLVRRTATDRELGSRAVEALVAIKGALAEPETCEWRPLEVGDYATKCGKLIGLVEWRKLAVYASELTLCPGCGREIKVKEESGGTT